MEPIGAMQPPTAHLPAGAPLPTIEDPTALGNLCGARRREGQIEQDRERGIEQPWPWCGMRSGHGTDHPGIGRCSRHGGSTPGQRRNIQLRLSELVSPAIATLARALVEEDVPWPTRRAASNDVLDRAGYPRRLEVDIDAGKARLHERILEWQTTHQDDPEEGDDA